MSKLTDQALKLNPLNDYLFYKVMGEKGDESQLLAFLNAVLKRADPERLVSVTITENRVLPADVIGGKGSVLDVRAELLDGTLVNIELQVKDEGNMDKRGLFYWSRMYAKGIGEGEDYALLPKVIAINIVNYNFPKSPQHHTCFRLREDREHDLLLTDALEIHYINMVKWRKQEKKDMPGEPLDRWLAWLDKKNGPELAEEAVRMDSGIAAAQTRLEELSDNEDVMRLYEMREIARINYTSGINHALRKGEAKGMVKGLAEGMMAVAAKMKAMGEPAEKIQAITGLSVGEIEAC